MKTIIFGGSFDPVHLGHLHLANNLANQAEKIIFVPCFQNPLLDKGPQASSEDRLNMLKLATKDNPKFIISDFELTRKEKSYTINTLRFFSQNEKEKIGLILGVDTFLTFKEWKEPEEVLKLSELIIYNRPGIEQTQIQNFLKDKLFEKANIIFIAQSSLSISSTQIKIYSFLKEDISPFTTPEVASYIKEKKIYQLNDNLEVINDHLNIKEK